MDTELSLYALGVAFAAVLSPRLKARLDLSRAKHRSLTGHARMSRMAAKLVSFYEFGEDAFYTADDAPADVAARRQEGFARLGALYRSRFPDTLALTRQVREGLSDLQFTSAYRVPFQFSRHVREHLGAGAFLGSADGIMVTDLDGNRFYDLTGSYGVNVFGHDFYKQCMTEGSARAASMGVILGSYHPAVACNVQQLREISGLDEVSFHMSGTEAVMQAVRLARYHTGRRHVVRFCGAYHGWWGDVQPGVGNPTPARDTYTLKDMDERSLHVLRTRRDIACVLVNPLQALHPNRAAPADGSLIATRAEASCDRATYAAWLRRLREVCTERGIALILDEVFLGFRLAPGGAQEYFGVKADLVTYGKTVAGGFPIGVLCGTRKLMKRFREDKPADICFARGTFNAHPHVMAAMQVFLERLKTPAIRALYNGLDARWDGRARVLNEQLAEAGLPVRVAHLSSVWTVCYTRPSRYHWMFQYYLRAEELALSWVGTGRLIFSLDYTDADFTEVARRFLAAANAMARDGWWWEDERLTDGSIRRSVLREMLQHRLR
jgi:glutamate-1-semialdehyde 2,1-aminomutase